MGIASYRTWKLQHLNNMIKAFKCTCISSSFMGVYIISEYGLPCGVFIFSMIRQYWFIWWHQFCADVDQIIAQVLCDKISVKKHTNLSQP